MTKVLDNLQHVQKLKDKIITLVAEIKSLRLRLNENNISHQEREKKLLKAISQANQRTQRRDKRIKSLENSIHDLKGNYGVS
jgi:chorismate mutase